MHPLSTSSYAAPCGSSSVASAALPSAGCPSRYDGVAEMQTPCTVYLHPPPGLDMMQGPSAVQGCQRRHCCADVLRRPQNRPSTFGFLTWLPVQTSLRGFPALSSGLAP